MQALVKGSLALSRRVSIGRETRGVGAKRWSVKFRLCMGNFFAIFVVFNKGI